jgi:hypothetical protein
VAEWRSQLRTHVTLTGATAAECATEACLKAGRNRRQSQSQQVEAASRLESGAGRAERTG